MNDVVRHYDLLVEDGNDPVLDPPELAAYMDGWDGACFMDALGLDGTKDVLEIGVGTGRLALRTAPRCRRFTGIDISPKSIARAGMHLADLPQVSLLCADFMHWQTAQCFDVVYSSLTFLHLKDKRGAAKRVAALLKPGGRAVISLDKSREPVLEYGTRSLSVYPDDPAELSIYLTAAGLTVLPVQGTDFAYILTATKGENG